MTFALKAHQLSYKKWGNKLAWNYKVPPTYFPQYEETHTIEMKTNNMNKNQKQIYDIGNN